MTTRREKNKPTSQQPQQQMARKQPRKKGRWKENLGKYLLDVSKYVLTGVVITSLFKGITDYVLIYTLGIITVVITLITGLILTNEKVED